MTLAEYAANPPVPAPPLAEPAELERRGRRWIFGSFVFCPCHLPLTLGVLGTVLGGTGAGAALHDHAVAAGVVITATWVVGTWRGFRLVRLAQRGSCPVPPATTGRPASGPSPRSTWWNGSRIAACPMILTMMVAMWRVVIRWPTRGAAGGTTPNIAFGRQR